ncbi:BORC8 protein, partial [Thryothorus ludovicianus]|nr:BORC8 protein [Thryothorus ludovicianus]
LHVLANEPSVALFRLQEHVRRSLPELAQHKSMADSSVYFRSIDSLLKHSIALKEQLSSSQARRYPSKSWKKIPGSS